MRPSLAVVPLLGLLCASAHAQTVAIAGENGAPVGFVVPLGIEAPAGAVSAFRVVATLPAGVGDEMAASGRELRIRVAAELLPGVAAPEMPAGHPRSAIDVPLRPIYPAALHAKLKLQRGANLFQSSVIVAIADPRASRQYVWPAFADKRAEGCANCDRPTHLAGKTEAEGVYELFTAGRHIAVGLDAAELAETPYSWLATNRRLTARAGTIMADTIRPPAIRVAANVPPVAGGLLQETTYLHSGELETSGSELAIGRMYRSRTIGLSPLGFGWDADVFRRLRLLPNGDVELRDGGEIWVFRPSKDGYESPSGLFLRLARNGRAWSLVDQRQREARFDDLGRLVSASDEFLDPAKPGSGNTTRFAYGEDGRLKTIVDTYGRETKLDWEGGLLRSVADWRGRRVVYHYDAQRRLEHVDLPEVAPHRPRIDYTYAPGALFNEQVERAANLVTIRDPKESATNGPVRVTFGYTADQVTSQRWATGENATFAYPNATSATVVDALGQERRYVLSANDAANLLADRAHVTELRETAVQVWSGAAFGQLPASATAGVPIISPVDRVTRFRFENGVLRSSSRDGVGETAHVWETAQGGPGLVVKSTTTTPLAAGSGGALSFLPAVLPITRTFHYQPGSTFLEGIDANGSRIEIAEPHRQRREPRTVNDAVAQVEKYDDRGRLRETGSSGGTDSASAGAKAGIRYFEDTDPPHKRGRPRSITEGEGAAALVTTYDYPTALRTVQTDPRGVITTTDVDTWDRLVKIRVERPGDPLTLENAFFYDATGRLERTEEKKGSGIVTTQSEYDVMGRPKSVMRDGIATVGSVTSRTEWDLRSRRITKTHEGGAVTTHDLDPLGRIVHSFTETGSSPIEQRFAYDLAGNRVFTTDLLTASASAFDVHGRRIGTRHADGTADVAQHDAWDRVETAKSVDAAGATSAQSTYQFTPSGRLQSLRTQVDADLSRVSSFAWDGGGRTTREATNGRAAWTSFDVAGRLKESLAGKGDLSALDEIFAKSKVTSHSGALPEVQEQSEKTGGTYEASAAHNVAADVTEEKVGSLEWKRTFDELGNVTAAATPGREATQWNVDSRGAVEKEIKAGGAENQYAYDASGAESVYTDPAHEPTSTKRDLLGRPVLRTYLDTTTEVIEWEGARLKSVTDRQGRKQSYLYNAKGQLAEIRDGQDRVTDLLKYDDAGRLKRWTTADAEVTWGPFDLDGNPKRTSQKRFRNGTGLQTVPLVLDEIVQEHRWNEHGERVRFSMPAAPDSVPGGSWTRWLRQAYDAMGNVTEIARLADELDGAGTVVMTASYRGAGRPDVRTVIAPGGPIVRTYAYDAKTSLLNRVEVQARGVVVAGSEISHDGLQVSEARILGVSSESRASRFVYDARSRLEASVFGTKSAAPPTVPLPGRAKDDLSSADFRRAQERTSSFDEATRSLMTSRGVDTSTIDPPAATFDEKPGGGHKIEKATKGPVVRPFGWNGAERVDDGRFVYRFDARGRLVSATERAATAPKRRIVYFYTGEGRVVGRRAEYTTSSDSQEDDWKLEDRAAILAGDALPADTTFAWDPISDRLVAVFAAGRTTEPLKQIVHGDAAYDDPLETTTAASRLYPVYDEAAAGGLQLVLDANATVVARNLPNDPYGGDDVTFSGASIDGVSITFSPTAVTVSMRSTERLDPSTVTAGVRLAALDLDGRVVATAGVVPALSDPYTAQWTLTLPQWSLLAAPPAESLSIAATSSLRASAWSADLPIAPPPEWAIASKPVFTSPAFPFELRESLVSLASFLASLPPGATRTTTLYEVESLALLASSSRNPAIDALTTARFQALPFAEPMTGLVYARARWYDPNTGSFLSPDPKGYVDSSNLYSFAGGDPVNGRDPTGEDAYDDKYQAYVRWYGAQVDALWQRRKAIGEEIRRRRGRDVGDLQGEDNILAARMLTFGGISESALLYFEAARAAGDKSVLCKSFEQIHAEIVSDEAVRFVGAGVVCGFMPHAPAARQSIDRGGDRIATAYNNSILSSETGAVGPNVVNRSKAARKSTGGPGNFVPKNESMRPTAAQYQDDVGEGVPGHVYRVPYANPNPRGKPHVDFDGVQGTFPIDAKLSVVTRPKTVSQAIRQAHALRETGAKAIWKVPNIAEALRARKVIADAGAGDVIVVVVEQKP